MRKSAYAFVCDLLASGEVEMLQLARRNDGKIAQRIDGRVGAVEKDSKGFICKGFAVLEDKTLKAVALEDSLGEFDIVKTADFACSKVFQVGASIDNSLQPLCIDVTAPGDIEVLQSRAALGDDLHGGVVGGRKAGDVDMDQTWVAKEKVVDRVAVDAASLN